MNKEQRSIVVTGAQGLIGRHAVQALVRTGFTVYAVSRKPGPDWGVEWVRADLLRQTDREEIFRRLSPSHLLHLAWETTPGTYLEDNVNFNWLAASLEMLGQFGAYGGKRAVFAGTCFEYDLAGGTLSEATSPQKPASTYAKCKDGLNRLASLFCAKNGISFGWGRIFYVYGANEQSGRLTSSIMDSLRQKKRLTIKSGGLHRDYMYADDIGGALAKFVAGEVPGPVNICTGHAVSIGDFARTLARKLGGEELLTFVDDPGNQPPLIVGDNRRLRDEVGYLPVYDLDRGFTEMLANTGL